MSALELDHDSMQVMTFWVKSVSGQKQLASLLDWHLGTRGSQVLMHCGTVLGQGDVGGADELGPAGAAGEVLDTGLEPEGPAAGVVPEGLPVTAGVDDVSEAVMGQTVVEMAMVEVTTTVECAGQLVTVGAQLVMVTSVVV